MASEKSISYYKDTLPELVEQLKDMVENNLEIVGRNIDPLLSDSKIKSALESRRIATEDVIWACKEVDRMEFELNDIDEQEQNKYLEQSYYRRIIPRLIKEIKGMVENNLGIVGKEIIGLTDDKLKLALSSRKMAAEDAVWASKQVDTLEKDLTGKNKADEAEQKVQNWTKRKASKK
ncbi:hypothetical protein [Aquimarina longa]|uniref:hypothetical protein n=1 Tax=Aquimarina longa TaxID=1080221 RepID=UPI000783CCD1|nr:hypothetical protein [Aquimarina longa]